MTAYTINKEEFTILNESPADTQKKIRQWVSTGYKITIINQIYNTSAGNLITTLTRSK